MDTQMENIEYIPISLAKIQLTSVSRASRWHPGGLEDWTPLEWAGAMAGEAGEACNAAKKLKRVMDGITNINLEDGRSITEVKQGHLKVAMEVADTILYGVLLAARVGYVGEGFQNVLVEVFNRKSEEYGFPERL
jgi:hypothetical protein